jgi:hypothetical protein
MTITREQRTWARLAAIILLAKYVLEGFGDSVTMMARGGESFAETARYAADHMVLWRFCLLNVGLAWIATGLLGFALYVVLEPVNKRLAQLALVLRLGAWFVGGASLMFRVAQARLYSVPAIGVFTTEQLSVLDSVTRRGAGAGVVTAWMLQAAGLWLFFVLLLRSRYVPRALAWSGIITEPILLAASAVMFVSPQFTNELKLTGLPAALVEVVTAVWLLSRGLAPRATEEAKV